MDLLFATTLFFTFGQLDLSRSTTWIGQTNFPVITIELYNFIMLPTTQLMKLILKIFIIAVKENMIDIFYFGPLILKTVELCLKKG